VQTGRNAGRNDPSICLVQVKPEAIAVLPMPKAKPRHW
jgi:hypothetical protein